MIPLQKTTGDPETVPVRLESDIQEAGTFVSLTSREYEIAKLVAMGFANKEVGRMLEISHWTVAAHLKATFLKLGIKRRAELAYLMRKVV